MGHSNTAITSRCFVSIGVALDEIWRSTFKCGSSCGEIRQRVKRRRWAARWQVTVYFIFFYMKAIYLVYFFCSIALKVMTCCRVIHGSLITGHSGAGSAMGETLQLYRLLLCQINIEVSGAPHCSSVSACCCLERGKGHITWELPLSSFILTKLALHLQDSEDYYDSAVEYRVEWQCYDCFCESPQDNAWQHSDWLTMRSAERFGDS